MAGIQETTNARFHRNIEPIIAEEGSLLRFRIVADTFIAGPADLFVLRTSALHEHKRQYERILHISLRIADTVLSSWAIYRQEREWETDIGKESVGMVLRRSKWDIKADLSSHSYRIIGAQPTISITTRYVDEASCTSLISSILELDRMLISGVSLNERSEFDQYEWHELAIFRALDWGILNLAWNFFRENVAVEELVFRITKEIDDVLDKVGDHKVIELIEMLYESPRTEAAKILYQEPFS